MKIRFWCDVPDPCSPDYRSGNRPYVWSIVPESPPFIGRRFTFEVDFPVRSTADAEEVEASEPEEAT